jgi:hypothetical protein
MSTNSATKLGGAATVGSLWPDAHGCKLRHVRHPGKNAAVPLLIFWAAVSQKVHQSDGAAVKWRPKKIERPWGPK